MEMKQGKFFNLVRTVEESQWLNEAVSSGQVTKSYHPSSDNIHPRHLGRFTPTGFTFSCPEFAVQYHIEEDIELTTRQWYLVNHITDRNRITARLMAIIGNAQYSFIFTGNPSTVHQLPYQSIVDEYNRAYPDYYMDSSIISRIVTRGRVQLPGGDTVLLSDLFPRRSFLIGVKIRQIIEHETTRLTDRCIRQRLFDNFGVNISIRYVTYCRNMVGIPSSRLRGRGKPKPAVCLGRTYAFDHAELSTIPEDAGVYELSATARTISYPKGESSIVYYGSTVNMQKRLSAYINGHGHTDEIRRFVSGHYLNIRYLKSAKHKEFEARLIADFEESNGGLPLLNSVRPKIK